MAGRKLRPDSNARVLAQYLKAMGRHPLLTRQEEYEVAKVCMEGQGREREAARRKLINSNLRLVVSEFDGFCNYLLEKTASDSYAQSFVT